MGSFAYQMNTRTITRFNSSYSKSRDWKLSSSVRLYAIIFSTTLH